MAQLMNIIRTCSILTCLFFNVSAIHNSVLKPRIISLTLDHKICDLSRCKYLLNIKGGKFLGHYSWKLTPVEALDGSDCEVSYPNYELKEILTTEWVTKLEIILPVIDAKLYFCLYKNDDVNHTPFGGKWMHQGIQHFLDTNSSAVIANSTDDPSKHDNKDWNLSHDTDINYLQIHPSLSEDEINDIEVLYKNNYVPLRNLKNTPQFYVDNIEKSEKSINRLKRNIPENNTETLRSIPESSRIVSDSLPVDLTVNSVDLVPNINGITKQVTTEISSGFINDEDLDNTFQEKVPEDSSFSINNSNNKEIPAMKINSKDRFKRNSDNITSTILESTTEVSRTVTKETTSFDALNPNRRIRQVTPEMEVDFNSVRGDPRMMIVNIEGVRIEESNKEPKITEDGVPSVLADSRVTLRVFGTGITSRTVIAFTHEIQEFGQPCKFLLKGEYMVKEGSLKPRTALYEIIAPSTISDAKFYICAKNLKLGVDDPFKDEEKYLHQGTESFKTIATHNTLLPLWVTLILILTCLIFSALFSGLNLGLMSLDITELKIISNTGTEQERKYARAIMPVRDHGNYLLCSILLGNVAVNSTFTILLDELTSGLFAVIFSTLAIVLLGEITPQAICSRHGLMVGAKSIMVTKAVMALTAPMAFPVSKLLDYFLGEEIGSVYNRERLKELVKVTTGVNDLDKDEVNIISGALELRKKTVSDVMTKLEDVFMLPISSVLDFETMSEIIKSGYSRVPVYEGSRTNIITVLFIKDLAFVDPDDNTPLQTLCQYYQNPCNFVFEDVTLDIMFKQFKDGHKGHMAFVHRINNEGEGDPFYETIGLVTLEDVIEEMIQAEIVDETDVFMDNRTKRRRNKPQHKLQDFAAFAERHENQRIHISPQLTLATFQFLSTSVDAFRPDTVSETVLRRLLRQDVIHHIKLKGKTKKDPSTYVFQQGKPVDYFVLILEGRVEVTVGRENLVFEAGPFTYFGVQALTQNVGVAESPTPSAMGSLQNINMDSMLRHTFVPDYSVRAITELFYLTVKRSLHLAAKRATLMEKGALSKGATNEQFDTEVDKHLCNSSNNIPISLLSKKLLARSTSTASTRIAEDFGSTSYDYKFQRPSRQNIIELMQISQNYESSERLDAHSDKYTSRPSNCDKHWSLTDFNKSKIAAPSKSYNDPYLTGPSKSYTNACDTAKYLASCDLREKYNSDVTGRLQDGGRCEQCAANHMWHNHIVLDRSIDDSKTNETEHLRKKTKFHGDPSLLSFHELSPRRRDREELDMERRRIETEDLMLLQLATIIKMLERKQS